MGFVKDKRLAASMDNLIAKPTSSQAYTVESDSDSSDFEIVPTSWALDNNPNPPQQVDVLSLESDTDRNSDSDETPHGDIPPKPPDPTTAQAATQQHPQRSRRPPKYLEDFELDLDTLFTK